MTKSEFNSAIYDEENQCFTIKVHKHKNARPRDLQVAVLEEDMLLLKEFLDLRLKMDSIAGAPFSATEASILGLDGEGLRHMYRDVQAWAKDNRGLLTAEGKK